MKVGIVGWRGMVGSVLLQRMVEEGEACMDIAQQFSAVRKALDSTYVRMTMCMLEQELEANPRLLLFGEQPFFRFAAFPRERRNDQPGGGQHPVEGL